MNNSNLSIRSLSDEELDLIGGGNVDGGGNLRSGINKIVNGILDILGID